MLSSMGNLVRVTLASQTVERATGEGRDETLILNSVPQSHGRHRSLQVGMETNSRKDMCSPGLEWTGSDSTLQKDSGQLVWSAWMDRRHQRH